MTDQQYYDYKLLHTCTEEIEAEMIESFLKNQAIPVLRKYPGFSDISRIVGGMTKLGVNIYVPENHLEEAKQVLRDLFAGLAEQVEEPDTESESD